jgi:hypothetical protein
MTLFLHSNEPMKTVARDATRTVGDLLGDEGGGELWLENAEEPLDAGTTLADLPPNAHISRGACKRVEVTVKFNGEEEGKDFPPGATVAAVFAWATGGSAFELPAAQRPKHVLALCGTQTQPDKSTHLSELVSKDCELCFSLVPKVRFEG